MTVFSSQTPAVAVLRKGDGFFRGASYRVRIEKQGYKPQEVVLTSSLNAGWYLLGNIIIGGLVGWLIVDPLTGGMWTLSPDKVSANLASDAAFLKQKDGLMIVLLEDIPSSLVPSLGKFRSQTMRKWRWGATHTIVPYLRSPPIHRENQRRESLLEVPEH